MQTSVLEDLHKRFEEESKTISDLNAFTGFRDKWLGRERGIIPEEFKKLGSLPKESRPEYGKVLNRLKGDIEKTLAELLERLKEKEARLELERQRLDVTLPGYPYSLGKTHPLRLMKEQIEDIFVRMGFTVAEGPEIETDYYNFEALNIPKDHPARDAQDTFYITEDILLRTHTSPVQIRTMQKYKPPIRVIAPGRCFRRDKPDATHSPVFYQVEGFVVGEGITLGDLKGTLEMFLKELFSPDIKVRFHPGYFPFVEPGAEVDVSCIFCLGAGCRVCKQSGWIEILGAGMIHPKVFEAVGYDPEKYTGFAWGLGIDRVALLKYGIEDIRLFYENDLRFLSQFS